MVFAVPHSKMPPARRQLRGAVVLLALALAGCSAGTPKAGGTPAASETATPAGVPASTAAPAPSSAPASSKTPSPSKTSAPHRSATKLAVTLVKTGGFAGLTETITVQPNGKWKKDNGRTTNRTGALSAAQVSRLQALLADPQLAAEAKQRPPGTNTCNDTFSYVLMVDYQVIKYEECPGQAKPPKVTMEIVAFLQEATAA